MVAEPGRERVHGVVDAPAGPVEAHELEQPHDELALVRDREVTVQTRVVDAIGVLSHSRDQATDLRLELVEQPAHFGRPRTGLEVVQQRVIGTFEIVEAVDVASHEFEVALQVGHEGGEIGLPTRLDPRLLADGPGARHVGGKLARNPSRLIPAPPDHPYQRGVVGVRMGAVETAGGRFDQPAGVIGDEHFVADALDRRRGLGPAERTPRRHHRLLVPVEQLRHVAQVGQLGHPFP